MKPVAYSFPFFRVARLALPLAALLVGCSTILGFDDTTLNPNDVEPGGEEGGSETGTPTVVVSPPTLLLRRGGSANLSITVNRNGVTGNMAASLDLPTGVTANQASLTIPDSQNTATISLTAATSATLGSKTAHLYSQAYPSLNTQITIFIADNPGTLDTTFGTNGANGIVSSGDVGSTYHAIYVQSDGSILAGGATAGGQWLLDRYLADGTLDPTFGGIQTTAGTSLPNGTIHALAVDSNKKIICVGDSMNGILQMTVMRLNTNGVQDTSKDTPPPQPLAGTEFAGDPSTGGYGVATLADNSILIAGTVNVPSAVPLAPDVSTGVVVHLLQDGTGNLFTTSNCSFVGIAPVGNGSTFVVGGTDTTKVSELLGEGSPQFYVARYTAAGTLDPSFSDTGFSFGVGGKGLGFAAASDSSSFVVVGNDANVINNLSYPVGLVSPAANPQTLYRGAVTGYNQNASFNAVTVQSDSLVVAAGNATNEARVTRIKPPNLDVDTAFGNVATEGSFVETPSNTTFNAVAMQPSNYRILAAGSNANGAVIYGLWQ